MTTQEPPGGPLPERPWSDSAGQPPPPPPPAAPESPGYPPSVAPGSAPPDYPAVAAYPPGAGYGAPPGYGPPGYPPAGMPPPRPYDPLIAYDFSSWLDRLKDVLKRSWKRVLKLIVLGAVLPAIGLMLVLGGMVVATVLLIARQTSGGDSSALGVVGVIAVICLYLGIVVGIHYLVAVTNVTVMKTAANDAAGQEIPLMTAYKSSLRLGWPTLGWLLLGGLVTGLGLLACFLPGLYLYVALSMIVPIMAFERHSGFTGSFQLIHSNFWPAAGRIGALFGISAVMSLFAQILYYAVMVPASLIMEGDNSVLAIVVLVIVAVFVLAVMVAASLAGQVVMLCGYLVTYAELRARLQPELTTAQLAAEANA